MRLHGTTRKVPKEVFQTKEKSLLKTLPPVRYEIYNVETRKVNNYGHVVYQYNYYSVPSKYQGKKVYLKTNGNILKIYDNTTEIATHALCHEKGEFITVESHKPFYKQRKESSYYEQKAMSVGINVYDFAKLAKEKTPYSWQRTVLGVISLCKKYNQDIVNKACLRAIHYGSISFRSVKEIIKNDLYNKEIETDLTVSSNGFATELSHYDKLFKGASYVSR